MGDDGALSPDDRPGGRSTLGELYRTVPASEEYDAREGDVEAARTAWWREVAREVARLDREAVAEELAAAGTSEAADDPAEADGAADTDDAAGGPDEETLTPGQALGMIEHLLDAEVIDADDDADDADDADPDDPDDTADTADTGDGEAGQPR